MKPGIRHGLLALTGLAAVLLIVFFTAYGLTTFGSIRGIVGNIAADTDQAASLHNQFSDMSSYFGGNKGDTYTYRFGGLPISVDKSEAGGLDESRALGLVLDIYTSDIYHVKFSTGLMGRFGSLFNAEANSTFGALTLIFLAAFILLATVSLLPIWEGTFGQKLKEEGLVILAFCAVSFFVFLVAPALIKSIIWGSIPSSDVARDIINIIQSRIVSSLLLNDILIGLVGILLFALGFFRERKAGESEAAQPRSRPDAGRRAPQPPKKGGEPQGQQKSRYKGL